MTVRAVFFDAGFTLIHPTRPVADVYVEAARALPVTLCHATLREAFHAAWAAGTRDARDDHRSSDALERDRWRHFTRRIAEAVPNMLAHHDAWLAHLVARFDHKDSWRLAPGAERLLRDLRDRGIAVGVVSNWHGGLTRLLDEIAVTTLVDFVVCSADLGYRKPHPEIFNHALRRAGVAAAEAMHVGDTFAEDVVGARGVGITPVHIHTTDSPRRGPGHHSIDALDEIRGLIDLAGE